MIGQRNLNVNDASRLSGLDVAYSVVPRRAYSFLHPRPPQRHGYDVLRLIRYPFGGVTYFGKLTAVDCRSSRLACLGHLPQHGSHVSALGRGRTPCEDAG